MDYDLIARIDKPAIAQSRVRFGRDAFGGETREVRAHAAHAHARSNRRFEKGLAQFGIVEAELFEQ
jgi:hypothetical protein